MFLFERESPLSVTQLQTCLREELAGEPRPSLTLERNILHPRLHPQRILRERKMEEIMRPIVAPRVPMTRDVTLAVVVVLKLMRLTIKKLYERQSSKRYPTWPLSVS